MTSHAEHRGLDPRVHGKPPTPAPTMPLVDPRSGLDPITLLRDVCDPEWHDCMCDAHEAARYYLEWLDRKEPAQT